MLASFKTNINFIHTIGCGPMPVTVTTRISKTFLVGDLNLNLHLGPHPKQTGQNHVANVENLTFETSVAFGHGNPILYFQPGWLVNLFLTRHFSRGLNKNARHILRMKFLEIRSFTKDPTDPITSLPFIDSSLSESVMNRRFWASESLILVGEYCIPGNPNRSPNITGFFI